MWPSLKRKRRRSTRGLSERQWRGARPVLGRQKMPLTPYSVIASRRVRALDTNQTTQPLKTHRIKPRKRRAPPTPTAIIPSQP